MPWFKVDDTFAYHAKVLAAGNAAIGLWVRAGAWSSQQLTDGFIPKHVVTTLGKMSEARRLVDVGLWVEKDGGYLFHQWSENGRQPTRVSVEAEREAARERQRKGRERQKSHRESHRDTTRDTPRDSQRSSPVSHGGPDPTRPEGSVKSVDSRPVPNTRGIDDDDLDKITRLLGCDRTDAWCTAIQILDRARTTVAHPGAYVLRAITTEPHLYRPTNRPPRADETCPIPGHTSWANNCAQCASEAKEAR
jgi:hypothetical protein